MPTHNEENTTLLRDHLRDVQEHRHGLPGIAYTDEGVFAEEAQHIFHADWVFACAEAQVSEPGSYYAFDLCGEPVVVLRGKDGQLRAMSNLCRHRGTPLLDNGNGQAERLTCPYHAWTYDETGRLKAIPHPGKAEIDKSEHCLPQYAVSTWSGLVFVCLDSHAAPLAPQLAGINRHISEFQPERFVHFHNGDPETWQANWKLVYENAAESYHLFKVHRETLETITPTREAHYIEGSPRWTVTGGGMQAPSGWFDWLDSSDIPRDRYLLIALPPGFVAIVTHDSMAWLNVRPLDTHSSQIESGALATQGGKESKGNVEFVSAFYAEDKFICERVQTGMYSQHAQGGPLVELEEVLVDFYRYLEERL